MMRAIIAPLACGVVLGLACPSCHAPAETAPRVAGATATRMDRYLEGLTKVGVSGSVVVARQGRVILARGYGEADRARNLANTADTVMPIESLSKQFTAAAILKLEAQGRLETGDPISRFFPEAPASKAAITLHQLLSHTSGLPDMHAESDTQPMTRDEAVRRILGLSMQSKPGEQWSYSNAGYTLLAAVVEVASGRPFRDYLHENLLKPASLMSTGWFGEPAWRTSPVAHAYNGDTDEGAPALQEPVTWALLGAGGMVSSASDLYRWVQALEGDRILPARERTKLFREVMKGYAYGWEVGKSPAGTRAIWHGGYANSGASSLLAIFPDDGAAVVTLFNSAVEPYATVGVHHIVPFKLIDALFGRPLELPPSGAAAAPSNPAPYCGEFDLSGAGRWIVSLEEGRLILTAEGQNAVDAVVFPSPPPGDLASSNARAASVVEAARKGDFEPLRRALADPSRYESARDSLLSLWKEAEKSHGAFQRLLVLGTVPEWWDRSAGRMTLLRLEFAHGTSVWRVHEKEEGITWILEGVFDEPVVANLLPLSGEDFVSYHLGFGRATPMRFVLDGSGNVAGLIADPEGRNVRARKVGPARSGP